MRLEAQRRIKLRHHRILGRRKEIPINRLDASIACAVNDSIQHCHFHLALQDSAAHEPKVHVQCGVLLAPEDDRDQTVVAELVRQLAVEPNDARVADDPFHIGKAVPLRCQVELVSFVGQLRDAVEVDGFEGVNLGDHFERIQILAIVSELVLLRGTLRIVRIQRCTFQIFSRE